MPTTTNAKPKTQHDTYSIAVSHHERMLLVLYRSLTADEQAAVDRALSYQWAGPRSRNLSPEERQAATARWGAAVEVLVKKAAHPVDVQTLTYFANCWRDAAAGDAPADEKGGA